MTEPAPAARALDEFGAFPVPETSPVVVLDDDVDLGRTLGRFLASAGYPVRVHAIPSEALSDLEATPAGVLLVDLHLGSENGLDVARQALELDPSMAIIMITGRGSESAAIESFRLGLSDYLVKPFDLNTLGHAVQRALLRRSTELRRFRNEELLRNRIAELRHEGRSAAMKALGEVVWSLEAKHPFLRGHSSRVASLAEALGREMGLPDVVAERLRLAGLLHDVGMIAVPDRVLHNTGALDAEDLQRVRSHPTMGAELTRAFGMTEVASAIEFHHERLDGSGYPFGLRGTEIPKEGLIIGVAEVFSALTEARPFREASTVQNAIDTLRGAAGVWFPGPMIEALERAHVAAGPPSGGPSPNEAGNPSGLRLI